MDKELIELERWLDKKKIMDYNVTIYGTDPYVADEDIFDINIDRNDIEEHFVLDQNGVDEA